MATMINYGGMGVKKMVSAKDVISLPTIDADRDVKPIKSIKEAIKLLKSFY